MQTDNKIFSNRAPDWVIQPTPLYTPLLSKRRTGHEQEFARLEQRSSALDVVHTIRFSLNAAGGAGHGPSLEHTGSQVMTGSRCSRAAASYEADRALFMFLSAPIISSHPIRQAAEALVATPRLACSWSQNLLGKVDEEHAGTIKHQQPRPQSTRSIENKKADGHNEASRAQSAKVGAARYIVTITDPCD